jgi:CRISPR/Cas system-associated protein Cas10 (large subunit of type III CRISPR-Cas system)
VLSRAPAAWRLQQRWAAQAVAASVGGGLCEVTRRHASKREGPHEERNQKSVEADSTRRHGSSQTQVVENFDMFFGFDVFLRRERRQGGKKLQGAMMMD